MTGTTDRYGVIGNPVAHSLSPIIHAAFAKQTGDAIEYTRILAPRDGFATTSAAFFNAGGKGLNVTVPFKLEAFAGCGARVSERARYAGAVNVLAIRDGEAHGDNTDGIGLSIDLRRIAASAGVEIRGAHLLLVGAGGAARGVLGPLLELEPASLTIVNRDLAKALALADLARGEGRARIEACGFADLAADFDIVINGTSAGLSGEAPPVDTRVFAKTRIAYDMMYGTAPSAFLRRARDGGTTEIADGLGMLVEQAAESFSIWRGVRPETAAVLANLRADLARDGAPA